MGKDADFGDIPSVIVGMVSLLHSAAPCLKICSPGKADKVVYLCCRSAAASVFAFKLISLICQKIRGGSPKRELLQRQSVGFCPYMRYLIFPGSLRAWKILAVH